MKVAASSVGTDARVLVAAEVSTVVCSQFQARTTEKLVRFFPMTLSCSGVGT